MDDQLPDPNQSIEQMQLRANQAILRERPHEAIEVTVSHSFLKNCA